MKKMRKIMAMTLAFVMVMSISIPVSAAMSAPKQANKLGLMQGDQNGMTDEYLAATPTRLQAAIISLRLQGLEQEALVYSGISTFTDASDVAWDGGRKILAYLKNNPSAGWAGYPDGSFLPNEPIGAQAYVKVMLEALGYKQGDDFEWSQVFTFARTKGLTELTSTTKMTNEQLAIGSIDVMDGITSDGQIMLDKLIAEDKVDFDDAVAADLKDPEPTKVEVVSVKAPSLSQLVITFNQSIASAGDDDDYTITEDNGSDAKIDENSDFALSDDGKKVTITLTTAADQQDLIDLEIENVVDTKQTFEDVEFLDLTIPEVTGAEVVGADTIKVMFSEPMSVSTLEDKGNYEVLDEDGDELYIRGVEAGANNMSALVETYSDIDGTVTIEASGVEDLQGFAALKEAIEVSKPNDNDAPEVVNYKNATPRKVTLIFDNDIEIADADLNNYYHTNSNNEASEIIHDGNELTIKFPEGSEMPEGTAYIYIEKGAINDLWDNENDKIAETIKVVVDKTPPSVVGDIDVVDQDTIEVTYDQDIVIGGDFDIEVLEDGGSTDVTASGDVKSSSDSDVLEIDFSEPITGKYSVIIEGVEDEDGNEAGEEKITFVMDDETGPDGSKFSGKLYNANANTQLVRISFNGEEMDVDTITDKSLYFAGVISLDDSDVDFDPVDGGKAVEITIPESVVDLVDGDDIIIGRVKDASGNAMTTLTTTVTLDGDGTVAIEEVRLVDDRTIEVQIKDDVLVAYDADEFDFNGLGKDKYDDDIVISKVKSNLNSDNETVIVFTLSGDLLDTDTSGMTYAISSGAGENKYGEEIDVDTGSVVDKAAPEVAYEGIEFTSETKITITFTEDLDEDMFAPSGKNGFSVSGGDAELDSVSVAGDSVVLNGSGFTKDTNVSYNDAFGLTDENNNKLDDFVFTDTLEN